MKQSGIYKITINGKAYVGLSSEIKRRFQYHTRALKDNKHGNKHLQAAYNIHGTFSFEVIEECEPKILQEREVFWIEKLQTRNREYGYNMLEGGAATPIMAGENNPMYGRQLTGSENGMYGKHHNAETKAKIAAKTSEFMTGRKKSASHKAALSVSATNRYKEKALAEGRTLYRKGRWVKP